MVSKTPIYFVYWDLYVCALRFGYNFKSMTKFHVLLSLHLLSQSICTLALSYESTRRI